MTIAKTVDIGKALYYLIARFMREGYSYRAASLVYATLLALVPLMVVVFSILSLFDFFSGLWSQVQQLILTNFIPAVAQNISLYLQDIIKNFQALSLLNLVFLFITCLLLLYNISIAFDRIWRVQKRKNHLLTFSIYFTLILLLPVLIGLVLISTAWLVSISLISTLMVRLWMIQRLILLLTPYSILFLLFTFLNWILPTCHVRLRDAAVGGLVTTVLFECAKNIFVLYVKHFPTYQILYGALAIFPIFLLWLYIAWMIILFGGMISYAAAKKFNLPEIK
jgi:membrane protein